MKALSQLVELFEKDPSFCKEWKKDAMSAVNERRLVSDEAQRQWLRKTIQKLQNKNHLSKHPFLFGM